VKVRFGEFAFDPETRQLTRGDTALHLTPKAFDLLALLVERAPRVVTKAELHALLWPRTFVSDSSLVALVKELRRVLTGDGVQASPIRTATRVGYALNVDVHRRSGPLSFTGHCLIVGDRRVPLHEGENIVGRHEEADIRLDGTTVSRRHVRLLVRGDTVSLEDLESKNGTRVDGQAVSSPVTLRNGAEILVGSVPVVYLSSLSDMSTETQVQAELEAEQPVHLDDE